jgi:type IX secretion system PorP/SprF family membrane protein
MKKVLTIMGLALWIGLSLHAQQLPLYDQYMLNPFLLNPAVAGYDGYTSLDLMVRTQWVGIPNAPNNQVFSAQTRLLKNKTTVKRSRGKSVMKPGRSGRVGLGGYVFNDMNGSVSRTGVHFSYAYHLWLDRSQLSFGLGGTAYQFQIKKLDFQEDEPLVEQGIYEPVFVPDADFGIYYRAVYPNVFFAGVSVKNLLQSYLKLGNKAMEEFRLYRHFYVTGGYRFSFADFDLEPSLLVKMSSQLSPQVDINVKAFFMKNYWIGLSYRTNKTAVVLFGVSVKRIYFGYAFDYEFNSIMKYSFGSHEFSIAVKLGNNARRFPWLERY